MAPGSDFGSWGAESLDTHTNRRWERKQLILLLCRTPPVHEGLFASSSFVVFSVCTFCPQPC